MAPPPPSPPLKIIFLDIDGVLNRTRSATHIRLDEDLTARLIALVEQIPGCKIVLSTFWRHFLPYVRTALSLAPVSLFHSLGSGVKIRAKI